MSPALACLSLDLLQALVGKKRGHVGALAASIAMNANDRIADRDPAADDPAKSDSAEVIAVVEIGDEHLKIGFGRRSSAAGRTSRSPRTAASCLRCSRAVSRIAKPFFALA